MTHRSAYELLQRVAEAYHGPRYNFIRARLSLQCGIDLGDITPGDDDPETAQKLEEAIRTVCPEVDL